MNSIADVIYFLGKQLSNLKGKKTHLIFFCLFYVMFFNSNNKNKRWLLKLCLRISVRVHLFFSFTENGIILVKTYKFLTLILWELNFIASIPGIIAFNSVERVVT